MSFVILLVLSTAASVLVLRQVLLERIGDEVERDLVTQLSPIRALADRTGPDAGESPDGVRSLVDAFLRQSSPPSDGAFLSFVDGAPYRAESAVPDAAGLEAALGDLGMGADPSRGKVSTNAGPARFVTVPLEEGAGVLVAASLTAADREQVERAVWIAVGVSAVVMVLAALFIWLAAGRTLKPIRKLAQTAHAISESDLSARITVSGEHEIALLGRTFNRMLDRLQGAFTTQKEFLGDASHELRTPITVIRGHLETLGGSPGEREEAVAVIQDELDRMGRYVDDLWLLSHATRPDFLQISPVDLDLFTHNLFTKARRLGPRDWRLDGTGIGILAIDQHRVTQAVMNLAENSVRHTEPGDRIQLGSTLERGFARIVVQDQGAGIAPEDQERIFERHARLESLPPGTGTGLGLAIVRTVSEAHGGWVELESEPGHGSTFTIVLPVEAP